jgi:hypothetical protein
MRQLLVQTEQVGALRGIAFGTDLYVWHSAQSIHFWVAEALGLDLNDGDKLVFSTHPDEFTDWPSDAISPYPGLFMLYKHGDLPESSRGRELTQQAVERDRQRNTALTEKVLQLSTWRGDFTVLDDPSTKQLQQVVADGTILRGLANEQHLFVWNAKFGTHFDVGGMLGLDRIGLDRLVFANHIEPRPTDWRYLRCEPVRGLNVFVPDGVRRFSNERVREWFAQPGTEPDLALQRTTE